MLRSTCAHTRTRTHTHVCGLCSSELGQRLWLLVRAVGVLLGREQRFPTGTVWSSGDVWQYQMFCLSGPGKGGCRRQPAGRSQGGCTTSHGTGESPTAKNRPARNVSVEVETPCPEATRLRSVRQGGRRGPPGQAVLPASAETGLPPAWSLSGGQLSVVAGRWTLGSLVRVACGLCGLG